MDSDNSLRGSTKSEMAFENAKHVSAVMAVREHVGDGMIVGIGTGTTVVYAVKELGRIANENRWSLRCVPTSLQALALLNDAGLTSCDASQFDRIDVCIDGADQVDPNLSLIKGMGGALTRERIVATLSVKRVIVADYSKMREKLKLNAVPIEVMPMSLGLVLRTLNEAGYSALVREGIRKAGPVITDNGNVLIDLDCSSTKLSLEALCTQLRLIPGVVDCGIFFNLADIAYIGCEDGSVSRLERST